MKSAVLAAPLVLLFAGAAHAQHPAPYDCQNEPVRVDIPAQALPRALDALTRQTNCPISRTVPIAGVRGNAVRGRMLPPDALVALVRGTGLEGRPIRQGLTVDRADQQAIAARAAALDRRIRARRAAGHLSARLAASLSRQVAQVRRQVIVFARRQGFVSAAEKASFQRTFRQVDMALGAAS